MRFCGRAGWSDSASVLADQFQQRWHPFHTDKSRLSDGASSPLRRAILISIGLKPTKSAPVSILGLGSGEAPAHIPAVLIRARLRERLGIRRGAAMTECSLLLFVLASRKGHMGDFAGVLRDCAAMSTLVGVVVPSLHDMTQWVCNE